MSTHCPSDLALELFLAAPDRSKEAPHVTTCAACAARLAEMREQGEEFRRVVFPQTVDAVEEAFTKRRFAFRWRPFVLAPAGAIAVALVALFLVKAEFFDDEYEYGVKGSGMTLAVFANGTGDHCAIQDGGKVPAASTLWFKVQPAKDCWLWMMSVDAQGQVSRLYPPKGATPDLRRTGQVPVGAALDGLPGPERIYAVCAPSPETSWDDVRTAAAEAIGGPERLRAARSLGGGLSRALQSSLLIEKQP
jgi:hypothetical protein